MAEKRVVSFQTTFHNDLLSTSYLPSPSLDVRDTDVNLSHIEVHVKFWGHFLEPYPTIGNPPTIYGKSTLTAINKTDN